MKLYVDGGVLGGRNPGDGTYWSVGTEEDGVLVHEKSYEHTTNNDAEYLALIEGLKWLICNWGVLEYDGENRRAATICSDSQLIVNQFNGRWTCGKPHLQAHLKEALRLWESLREFLMVDVELVWVRRKENVRILGH